MTRRYCLHVVAYVGVSTSAPAAAREVLCPQGMSPPTFACVLDGCWCWLRLVQGARLAVRAVPEPSRTDSKRAVPPETQGLVASLDVRDAMLGSWDVMTCSIHDVGSEHCRRQHGTECQRPPDGRVRSGAPKYDFHVSVLRTGSLTVRHPQMETQYRTEADPRRSATHQPTHLALDCDVELDFDH